MNPIVQFFFVGSLSLLSAADAQDRPVRRPGSTRPTPVSADETRGKAAPGRARSDRPLRLTPVQSGVGSWTYSWGSDKATGASMGTAAGRTCFLTGISGNLAPDASPYNPTEPAAYAGVAVYGSDYQIQVRPKRAQIQVWAQCLSVPGTEPVAWVAGRDRQSLQPTGARRSVMGDTSSSNRTCFLTGIQNDIHRGGDAAYWGLTEASHNVRLWHDVFGWWGGGDHPKESFVRATARCFDAGENLGSWKWTAADPGTRKSRLTDVTGAICGLTGIGGRFDAKPGDWTDGVYITKEGNQFYLNTANGKTGWATCVKP